MNSVWKASLLGLFVLATGCENSTHFYWGGSTGASSSESPSSHHEGQSTTSGHGPAGAATGATHADPHADAPPAGHTGVPGATGADHGKADHGK